MSSDIPDLDQLGMPDKIPVLGQVQETWEILYYATEQQARELLKARKVTLLHTAKRVRALKWIATPGERISFAAAELQHKKYSHNHETPTNPENCWTLVSTPARAIFFAAITSVHADCPLARVSDLERQSILEACLKTMQPKQVRLLTERYQHGKSFTAIARALRVSNAAVYAMHRRAIPKLRAELRRRKISAFRQI